LATPTLVSGKKTKLRRYIVGNNATQRKGALKFSYFETGRLMEDANKGQTHE